MDLLRTEASFSSGASWFYWIAVLSLVNSIIYRVGGSFNFIFGLGISQVVDVIAQLLAQDFPRAAIPIQVASLILSFLILAAFGSFGVFAHRRHLWAFAVGMVAYGLDGLLLLAFGDFVAFAFHLWAMYGLYRGVKALRKLRTLTSQVQPVA